MCHLLITLLLLAPCLLTQDAHTGQTSGAPPAPVSEKDKCTVEGKVLDASSGQPLRKTLVTLFPTERRENKPLSVSTDADGNFMFKRIDAGRFRLGANRRGYVSQQYGQGATNRSGTILTLQPGQHVKDILFRLQVSAAVSGRILDEDGEPMANVQVNALRRGYRDGRPAIMPAGFSDTNDLGEYRIFGLSPGEYFIRACYNGNAMTGGYVSFETDQAIDTTYAPTYYPGVQEISNATPITLRAADDVRANLMLNPTRAFSIRGRVINLAGASGGRAWLTIVPRDETESVRFGPDNNTVFDSDGSFEFRHILPGPYTINGRTGDDKGRYTARQNVDVTDRDVNNVIVAFRPAVEIPGRFTVDSSYQGRLKDLNIFLRPDSGSMMSNAGASAKDDGSFVIRGVADDLYRINLGPLAPNAYVKSVRYGSEDVLEKGFDPAGGHQSLEIVISGDGGRISGLVSDKDQKLQPGITVVAIPDHPLRWISDRSKSTSTDQNGRFNLQGLRPGRYRLYAFEEVEPGAYEDPQFIKRYLDRGKTADIGENSQQTIDLTIIGREENQ
jgi:protocatechuate 3,4-dioxygenase beta subunit